jgi:hypothetical protein
MNNLDYYLLYSFAVRNVLPIIVLLGSPNYYVYDNIQI